LSKVVKDAFKPYLCRFPVYKRKPYFSYYYILIIETRGNPFHIAYLPVQDNGNTDQCYCKCKLKGYKNIAYHFTAPVTGCDLIFNSICYFEGNQFPGRQARSHHAEQNRYGCIENDQWIACLQIRFDFSEFISDKIIHQRQKQKKKYSRCQEK